MNSSSNYGKPGNSQRGGASLNNFDFDLGIGSNKPRSLNDQKNKQAPYSYTSSSTATSFSSASQQKPSWQPNKPAWTHQPAPTQAAKPGASNGPTSMVGDIFGKNWGSSVSSGTSSGIGIAEKKNPNLFGDLVSSALGQGKSNSSAPLKNSTPVSAKSAYSMGNLADSLPKQPNSAKTSGSWGSDDSFGSFTSGYKTNSSVPAPAFNLNGAKNVNLGGQSMKTMAGGGVGINSNKDPFSNLVGLGSQGANLSSTSKGGIKASTDDPFGDFQTATKPSSTTTFSSSGFAANNNGFSSSDVKMGDFGMTGMSFDQPSSQSTGLDQFDSLFPSSTGGGPTVSDAFGGQQGMDDWGVESDFGGNDGGGTTELDGLPPPPPGVSASNAKSKGMENYKQGQYADAIKWLSWAEVLITKTGDNAAATEVLTCRASCYKEVGEYKKAVADCTKVLQYDEANVAVLCQRALLYESMEKYRLGADDLRTVLKIDPINRIARSTIHRLNKLAD